MRQMTKEEYLLHAESNIEFLKKENKKLEKMKTTPNTLYDQSKINNTIWLHNRNIEAYEADIQELHGIEINRPWSESLKERNIIKDNT